MDLTGPETPFHIGRLLAEVRRQGRELAYLRSARATTARGSYPPGTIPNTALKSTPAEPGIVQLNASGFELGSTEPTTLVVANLLVPRGYTACAVTVTGRVQAVNSLTTEGYVSAQVAVVGVTSNALAVRADPAGSADNTALVVATSAQHVGGLSSGGTVDVALQAWVDAGSWAADPDMFADLSGTVTWIA